MAKLTDNDRCLTIEQFCELENMCPEDFAALQRINLVPKLSEVLVGDRTYFALITPSARLEWHKRFARHLQEHH